MPAPDVVPTFSGIMMRTNQLVKSISPKILKRKMPLLPEVRIDDFERRSSCPSIKHVKRDLTTESAQRREVKGRSLSPQPSSKRDSLQAEEAVPKRSVSDPDISIVWSPIIQRMGHGQWETLGNNVVKNGIVDSVDGGSIVTNSLDQPSRTKTVSSLPVEDIIVSPSLDEDPDDNSPPSNNDDDLPTDLSDNTDCSDQEEIVCSGHEHAGLTTVDEVFNMTVDEMFTNLFTGSAFYINLQNAKKTQDMELCDWPEEPDADGHLRRVITYTLTLNNSLGPKNSYVREVQTRSQHSKPGSLYIIDCEVNNSGVPYGDNFYVTNRYCITKAGTLKCRLRVSCQIKYRKNVWGVVKNFIDKNVTQGLTEHFSMLANMLRKECNERIGVPLEPLVSNSSIKKRLRRRRRLMTELNPSPSRLPDVTAVNHVSSRLHGRSRSRSKEMSRSVERSSSIRWKEAKLVVTSCQYESRHLDEELISTKSIKYSREKSKSVEILNSDDGVEMYVCNCEGCKANVMISEGAFASFDDSLPRSNSCPNAMSKWNDPLPNSEPLSAMKVVPAENRMRWEENNDEISALKNIASNAHRNPFSRSKVRVKSFVKGHSVTAFLPFIQVLWTFAIIHERVSFAQKLSPSNVTLPWQQQRDSITTKLGEIMGYWYD